MSSAHSSPGLEIYSTPYLRPRVQPGPRGTQPLTTLSLTLDQFILTYKLADDTISIHEKRSKDMPGGKFLEASKILRPTSSRDDPEYYTEQDLIIGDVLVVH